MKMIIRSQKVWLLALMVMGISSATLAKPERKPVYYEDEIVTMVVVNDNVLGVEENLEFISARGNF